jgi:uncharacterized protein (TIGR03437 family)
MCVRASSVAVRLTAALLLSGALCLLCAERVRVEENELRLGERRFQIRGLHYAPVPIGARAQDRVPPCLYARDLPLAAAMGANTVRTFRLLPEGDTTFVPLLETTGLYWLAGFPLEPYYNPSLSILDRSDEILADFRQYVQRFQGQQRLLAFVFGDDVPTGYSAKFAGPVSEFHALLKEAAAVLLDLEPESTPLLATAVGSLENLRADPPGLAFWLWDPGSRRDLAAPIAEIRRSSSKPVVIAGFGADALDSMTGLEDEAAQAATALVLVDEIEAAPLLLGGLYGAFADPYGASARLGLFRPEAAGRPGFDSLHPRAIYQALAARWEGRQHNDRLLEESPEIARVAHAATGGDSVAPGALVRVTGAALSADPYIANGVPWPLHQAESCLCIGDQPVPLGMLSPEVMTAQVPWDVEPGEQDAIFFRAGVPAAPVKTKVDQYAPGLFPGTVLRAGTSCVASQENGVRPGETVELYGTGLGPGTPSLVTPKVYVNGSEAEVLSSGLAPASVGLNQVTVRVNPLTPNSNAASAYLIVEDVIGNSIPLGVARSNDPFGIAVRAPVPEVLLQAGGRPLIVELETEGVNGYCGPVELASIEAPAGVSFTAPAVTSGQTVRVELSAAPDAPAQTGAPMLLRASAPDVTGADAALRVTVLPSRGDIWLRAFSGGYKSSYPLARFDWDGRQIHSTIGAGAGRGIHVMVVDPATGVFSAVRAFDTWGDATASANLVEYLSALPDGALVLFAIADDGTLTLTREARTAIWSMFGSRYIWWLGYQQSWALIGRKGSSPFSEQTSSEWVVLAYTMQRFPLH